MSESNCKSVLIFIEYLDVIFDWYVITSRIDDTKNPGKNLNIFMSMQLVKV